MAARQRYNFFGLAKGFHQDVIVHRCPEGNIEVTPIGSDRLRIQLRPKQGVFIPEPYDTCDTSFPPDLIEFLREKIPFGWLCEAIARYEDPEYVGGILRQQIFAYVERESFRGRRVLDFGCGTGASTFALAEMLPDTEVTGVELNRDSVQIAEAVQAYKRLPNARFLVSPRGDALPPDIGEFDYVMLSAVYEHLLPHERRTTMPLVWHALRSGGVLFINQTPHSWFPLEHHSTGLWGINYLPDAVAHFVARKYARHNPEKNRSADWTVHLRGGIRGASEGEILRQLRRSGSGGPVILQPLHGDRASYWLSCTNPERHRRVKELISVLYRLTDRLFSTVPSMNVDMAIRKL